MGSVTTLPGTVVRRRKPVVPSAMLGTLAFMATEVMYFMALISAFNVIRSQVFGQWSPPNDLRLPVVATGFNTLVLLASGVLSILAAKAYAKPDGKARARTLFSQALLLGLFFVGFQGWEWVKLIRYGMTMSSGIFGATFFLLIGSHGLHALAAVLFMVWVYWRLAKGKLSVDGLRAMTVFWLFIVAIWPVLYAIVYLT